MKTGQQERGVWEVRRGPALIVALVVAAFLTAAAGARAGNAGQPQGAWVFVEAGGSPIAAGARGEGPGLAFDPSKRQASGFTECNRFSGGYEFDGASLRFGPVISTRRACPDPAGDVENRILGVLERTRKWEVDGAELRLLDDSGILARLVREQAGAAPADIGSMTYRTTVLPSGSVTLAGGSHREPAAPGSASEITATLTDARAFGTLGGRDAGAVVIATSTGGSGTFLELALLLREAQGWTNPHTVLLGDRVKVRSIAVAAEAITLEMTVHGPGEPACCPTQEVTRRFSVRDGRLVAAGGGGTAQ